MAQYTTATTHCIVGRASLEIHNARILSNLLASDLLDRFPKTKWVSVESGIGWIPFIIERLNWQIADLDTSSVRHTPPLELFRRQVYACFWFESVAPQHTLESIGFDNVLFETDFPHPTCLPEPGRTRARGARTVGPGGPEKSNGSERRRSVQHPTTGPRAGLGTI